MEIVGFLFASIILGIGILLVIRFSLPRHTRTNSENQHKGEHHEALREFHRMRRRRDQVWLRIDKLHAQFIKSSSIQKQLPEIAQGESQSSVGGSRTGEHSWSAFTPSVIEESFERFLKKD
ncbi:MAG: hypothetical protein AUG51_16275 [Acidobacteria bacterium 13_1_20CM_3_53_8]|nr:MAG: hypothetical protein AUG51_16275 [Acidobacteria bacterium 13_1_20CM_3_53_8]